MNKPVSLFLSAILIIAIVAGYYALHSKRGDLTRSAQVITWIRNAQDHPEWAVSAGERCGEAPFLIPTDGFIGFLWDDSFRPGHRHQGIDIFGGADVNITPVVAAASGFLTRQSDWKSSVIIRIPEDPLRPSRQIWTYYTHMADSQGNSFISPEFPPGTVELYVEAGTLLGYQGNYSGNSLKPTGIHLHFSIVRDNGLGSYTNELDIDNTLDPTPYLGLPLNARTNQGEVPVCP